MIRSISCRDCQFNLAFSLVNVAVAVFGVAIRGDLLGAAGLPFSFTGWYLHWKTCRAIKD